MTHQARKTRVLLVDLGASIGGVEAYLEALARILAADVDVYVLCVVPALQERMEKCGARVIRIPMFSRVRLLRFVSAILLLIYLTVRHQIDIVQINGFLESILLIPVRLLGREAFYTRHGPFELDLFPWYKSPVKYVPRAVSRHFAHLATRIICVSDTVGALYAPLFPEGRVVVIPNWVSTLPSPRTHTVEVSAVAHIICMGRLEKYKGVHVLLDAVREMTNVEVTIVGDGAYRQELEAMAANPHVRFAGFHQNPMLFYRQADIFVMPSLGPEGLPMVALEAMSQSLACVFSDLPVLLEITDNGRAAAIFRRGDVADLKEKLTTLVESRAERQRLGNAAYEIVKHRYHEEVVRSAYLQMFSPSRLTAQTVS